MAFTVGIPTRGDRAGVLCDTVASVLRSASLVSADAEVLVVVNGRSHVPELHAVDSPMLRVRYLPRPNVAEARNTVIAEARHDTILFTDEDGDVPPQWCGQLLAALREPGCAMVGAPVRAIAAGPVSAYLDHLRIADACPVWRGTSVLLAAGNCGLRRDRIPATVRFDPRLRSAGEDTGFALALHKAGLSIRWLGESTPIVHGCTEEIEEITKRFMRNARSGVHLFLHHGYAEAATPGALRMYRDRLSDDYPFDRRFDEFVAPQARTAFTVYDAIYAAVTAIGYLDELGTELGHPLLELDLPGLDGEWARIAGKVRERTAGLSPSDWDNLEVDYRGMAGRPREPEPLLVEVRQALRRYARPLPTDPEGPVGDVLNHGWAEMVASYRDSLTGIREAFDELCEGPEPPTPDALDRAVRAQGIPFKAAIDAVEFLQRRTPHRTREAAGAGAKR